MNAVFALIVILMATGEVSHTMIRMNDMVSCGLMALRFNATPLVSGVIDAKASCESVTLDPLRGSKPI